VENLLLYFLIFIGGALTSSLLSYILTFGYSILTMKKTVFDCLLVIARNVQAAYDIHELKNLALEIAGKDEKFIDFQKKLDQKELKSLKNTIIRNFINSVPPKYDNIIPFSDWDSAMLYLETEIKTRGKNNE